MPSGKAAKKILFPVLPAYETPDGLLGVWCCFCRRYHIHGPPAGHRVAHCVVNGSPYMATGYILHLEGGWDERPLMQGVRPGRLVD